MEGFLHPYVLCHVVDDVVGVHHIVFRLRHATEGGIEVEAWLVEFVLLLDIGPDVSSPVFIIE